MHPRRRSVSPHRAGASATLRPVTTRDSSASRRVSPAALCHPCNESLIVPAGPSQNVSLETPPSLMMVPACQYRGADPTASSSATSSFVTAMIARRQSQSVLTGRHIPTTASVSMLSVSDMTTHEASQHSSSANQGKVSPGKRSGAGNAATGAHRSAAIPTTNVTSVSGDADQRLRMGVDLAAALRTIPQVPMTEAAGAKDAKVAAGQQQGGGGPTPYEAALELCCRELLESVRQENDMAEAQRVKRLEERRRIGKRYRLTAEIVARSSEPRPTQRRRRAASDGGIRQQPSDQEQQPLRRQQVSSLCRDHQVTQQPPEVVTAQNGEPAGRKASSPRPVSAPPRNPQQKHRKSARGVSPAETVAPVESAEAINLPVSVHPEPRRLSPTHRSVASTVTRSDSQRSSSLSSSSRPAAIPLTYSSLVGGGPLSAGYGDRPQVKYLEEQQPADEAAPELLLFLRPRPAPRPWREFSLTPPFRAAPLALVQEQRISRSYAFTEDRLQMLVTPECRVPQPSAKIVCAHKMFVPTFALRDFRRMCQLRHCWSRMRLLYAQRQCERFQRHWLVLRVFSRWRSRMTHAVAESTSVRTTLLTSIWKRLVGAARDEKASRAVRGMIRGHTLRRVFFEWSRILHTSQLVRIISRRHGISRRAALFRQWASLTVLRRSVRCKLMRRCWDRWLGKKLHQPGGCYPALRVARASFALQVLERISRQCCLALQSRFWGLWRRNQRASHFRKQLLAIAERSHVLKTIHAAWLRWATKWARRRREKRRISLNR